MPRPVFSALIIAISFSLCACGVYEKHGYGWLAKSKLDEPTPVRMPPNAPSISQRFRPPDTPSGIQHAGIDLLLPAHSPVLAADDGVVARVTLSALYGKQILLNHDRDDDGLRLQTRYYHLTERRVSPGDLVTRGQIIGYSGMTGLLAGFPHLHFEVHRLNAAEPPVAVRYLDPQLFWIDGPGEITCFDRGRDYGNRPRGLTYPAPCLGVDWQ